MRLRRRGIDARAVDDALARLKSAGLVDDAAFARSWADSRDAASPRSRRLIARELRARGVAADLAHETAAGVSDTDAAYRVASRRARSFASPDYDAFRARLGGLLRRRGFEWSVAQATVDRYWRELHSAQDEEPA